MDPRRNEHYRGSTNDSKGFLRDRPLEYRSTHHSQDFYDKERDHKPMWQRLETNFHSYYPRHQENLNSFNTDYRKQRHDESVATSLWLPKSSSFQDEEARNYKLQRFNSGGNRDARQVLDKKRSSYQAPKESIKEYSREDPSPRKSARTHLTYMEKGKGI